MSLPAISKHLKVLQRAGLIEQGRQAQWRPCRLAPEPLREVAGWVDQYRRHWEESFERLSDYLRELQDNQEQAGKETTMTATRIDRGSTDTTAIYSDGGDLVFERTFDAPRERVWQAFTDPAQIVPTGGASTGRRRSSRRWTSGLVASGATSAAPPDREDVAFYGEYLEVDPPKGFKWTFMFDVEGVGPMGGPESYTLEDVGGRTKVVSIGHMGPSRSSRARCRPAWSRARSRPGTASRPWSPGADLDPTTGTRERPPALVRRSLVGAPGSGRLPLPVQLGAPGDGGVGTSLRIEQVRRVRVGSRQPSGSSTSLATTTTERSRSSLGPSRSPAWSRPPARPGRGLGLSPKTYQ